MRVFGKHMVPGRNDSGKRDGIEDRWQGDQENPLGDLGIPGIEDRNVAAAEVFHVASCNCEFVVDGSRP